jgi:hypothetical protein
VEYHLLDVYQGLRRCLWKGVCSNIRKKVYECCWLVLYILALLEHN